MTKVLLIIEICIYTHYWLSFSWLFCTKKHRNTNRIVNEVECESK